MLFCCGSIELSKCAWKHKIESQIIANAMLLFRISIAVVVVGNVNSYSIPRLMMGPILKPFTPPLFQPV